jgi:predicted naringenin-chalcone synthase
MGFKLTNSGMQMILDVEVPNVIASHFDAVIHPFLKKNQLKIKDIDYMIFHPGGKKIVATIEDIFAEFDKDIEDTKAVLAQYGNMSSATVLYVLERIMKRSPQAGELGLMLSFGPGFSAQRVLLQW